MVRKKNMVNASWMQAAHIGDLSRMTSPYQEHSISSINLALFLFRAIFVVAGQEDEFAIYNENGDKVETSTGNVVLTSTGQTGSG